MYMHNSMDTFSIETYLDCMGVFTGVPAMHACFDLHHAGPSQVMLSLKMSYNCRCTSVLPYNKSMSCIAS